MSRDETARLRVVPWGVGGPMGEAAARGETARLRVVAWVVGGSMGEAAARGETARLRVVAWGSRLGAWGRRRVP